MKDELYHQAILELAKRARGDRRLGAPTASVTVDNPLCGDRVTLDLAVADGKVAQIGHKVRGCLLCQAATTVIAEHAPGETIASLREVAAEAQRAVRLDPALACERWPEMIAFAPVHQHRSRHDCVLLPFDALTRALDDIEAG
jgi:nitrogen fixation NifU-like protein